MERTVITFSVENIITIFAMVAIVSTLLGLAAKLIRAKTVSE